ncbi:hypothetical protein DYU05_08595 [Mucilaginibacter terrenus]|uniref:Knr4/Smi1-like domain-containing protein n=1 Tax=Mucilaginibacter terrenus TaxID=2482727 RepID=A0A3E2NXH0_9SPHI|nr:SMI1/KNR4 family protein [Mucilaginibacter terrenus]RFZ85639.1 hypothetical protein DYU05_08595 [Mucilaginibacter terrenus]
MTPADKYLIGLFYDLIKKKNKKLHSLLGDGLAPEQVEQTFSSLSLCVPDEVKYLFTLTNGYKAHNLTIGEALLFDHGIPLSLEQAVNEWQNQFQHGDPELRMMLPIFENGGGDFLLVNCDPSSPDFKKIFIWSPPEIILEPVSIYSSLISLFSTNIRCFMVRAYYYDSKQLIIDDAKQYMEAVRLNRKCQYWNDFSHLHIIDYPW